MHISRDHVPTFTATFKTKYNREPIGNQLGQLHSDFPGGDEVLAVESCFILKKAYIDKLSTWEYQIRLKGIPTVSIQLVFQRQFKNDPMKLYEYLYNVIV